MFPLLRLARHIPRAPLRPFTTSAVLPKNKPSKQNLPARPAPPPEDDIEESFLKGSGPGGQKINKTSSAVQLKHIPTGIVVKSQATRSRSQNRAIARNILAARLDDLNNGDASRSAAVAERKRKKRASAAKKSRRKYRAHEAEKEAAGEDGEDGELELEHDEEIQIEVVRKGKTAGEAPEEGEGRHQHEEGKAGDSRG